MKLTIQQQLKKTEIGLSAVMLMADHGLIDTGWKFKFDSAKRRFGCCNYTRKTISLSLPLNLIRTEEMIMNTMLHEIAHALVGYNAGHGPVWKAKAMAIGCNGDRCSSDVSLPKKWVGTCPNGHTMARHRKSKGGACAKCCNAHNNGRYSDKYQWSWEKKSI